ncbi:extracellular solute-binding protein [Xylanimonas ulmi]|uniref:Carbohydrate ABC transporter substrate-binding protein (CUT1 family) n=1 Tax=Xylanimonas ulmi TaxID=228973 RepID=A0A4Q7M7Z5_9MICO|nr:extracellular solute-binding protein [Xylanibacterium ulmi]RZS62802.1 carbohydrate ABC transporter substrate-binding protein (CUT1 family) [Xylanibacterium ulmi]
MTRKMRGGAIVALGATVALLAAGCAGSGGAATTGASGSPKAADADAKTITWWHNSNTGDGKDYYDQVAKDFEEKTGVHVEVSAMQHEDMLTKLSAALQSGDPDQIPDVFMSRGGGELQNEVDSGVTRDLTDVASDTISKISAFTGQYTVDGKVYALPFSIGLVGFWYNKDLFAQAGITDVNPAPTIDEFNGYIDKLKAAGIAPASVGAGDKWPAAHYWYYNVVRECPFDTVESAIADKDYSDPCFLKAGEHLQDLVATQPFNDGFLSTKAQEGPTSASGLLATGKVAMELAGHWEPGVAGGLTADGKVPSFLGWFAYPTFPGQGGDPKDQMGGGDAWEVSTSAPDAAVDFAKYLLSDEVQQGFAERDMGLPTNPAATDSISNATLKQLIPVRDAGGNTQLYLDTRLGAAIGNPMNDAIAQVFAGNPGPQEIVDAIQSAADSE